MSTADLVMDVHCAPGAQLHEAVRARRIVLVAGLPGTGKSLLVQQLMVMAHLAGRETHGLQWDTARQAFETPAWLARFPEVHGVTHPGVRKAVGLWVRAGVARWDDDYPDARNLLIAEIPIVGGRFIELAQPLDDAAEVLLANERCAVFVPVPTVEVRAAVEGKRAATIANPRHANEAKDAPPSVVEAEWLSVRRLYNRWQGIEDDVARDRVYDPAIYRDVFERLMRFRELAVLPIDTLFDTPGSVYDRTVPVQEVCASEAEVSAAYERLAVLYPGRAAAHATDDWADY